MPKQVVKWIYGLTKILICQFVWLVYSPVWGQKTSQDSFSIDSSGLQNQLNAELKQLFRQQQQNVKDKKIAYRILIIKGRLGDVQSLENACDSCGRDRTCDPVLMLEAADAWIERRNYPEAVMTFCQAIARYEAGYESGEYMKGYRRQELYRAYFSRGACYFTLNKMLDALNDFARARDLNPKDPEVWRRLGELHTLLGNYPEALYFYDKAFELDPKSTRGWINYGFALGQQGEHAKALNAYNRGLAAQVPEDRALLLNNRGYTYLKLKKYEEAHADLKQAISLDPTLTIGYISLAEYHLERDEPEQALGWLVEAARQTLPTTQERFLLLYKRGWARLKLGLLTEALDDLTQATRLNTTHAHAWLLQGQCMLQLGMACPAKEALEQASRLSRNQPEVEREVVQYLLPLRQKKNLVCP